VLGMFKKMGKEMLRLDSTFGVVLEESKKISNQLKNAKRSGEICRKKAVWIGVMRYIACRLSHVMLISYNIYRESEGQVNEWLGKSMIEKEEQVKTGIESGALKEGRYICTNNMNRICAPKPGDCEVYSIILWTKESADDKVKTWDKVVCPTLCSNDI
jgi:hypothetical protein